MFYTRFFDEIYNLSTDVISSTLIPEKFEYQYRSIFTILYFEVGEDTSAAIISIKSISDW